MLLSHLPLRSVGSHMAYSSDYLLRGRRHCRTSSIQSNCSRPSSFFNFAYMCAAIGCGAEDTIFALPSCSWLIGVVIDIPQRSRCNVYHLWTESPVNIYRLYLAIILTSELVVSWI